MFVSRIPFTIEGLKAKAATWLDLDKPRKCQIELLPLPSGSIDTIDTYLGILLHEMLHSYFSVFGPSQGSAESWELYDTTSHGEIWQDNAAKLEAIYPEF